MYIEGFVKIGTRTKELVNYLTPSDIAVINHDDIDQLAAYALIDSGIKVILNTGKSMTGRYHSKGTSVLLYNNIKVFDVNLEITVFKDGDLVKLRGKDLILNNDRIFNNSCFSINDDYIQRKVQESTFNYNDQLASFIGNTIKYADVEKEKILSFGSYPDLHTNLTGRCAIVVVRSAESKEALNSLRDFILKENPVLIGVDGGADTILGCGFAPDVLIGDMDSVSDVGIFRSKEVILHAYADGSCPCIDRVAKLNIKYKVLPMYGTSEDVALLMAYDKGAASIILVGGHFCMNEFLERGRSGMGSTLITRFKIEERLIDYKHYNKMQNLMYNKSSIYRQSEGDLIWMKM